MLNSVLESTQYGRIVDNAIFSRFVTYDDSMRLVPDLITEIPTHANGGISADELTYTYHLRREARWHDDQPLTSADVLFTYRMVVDTTAGSSAAASFAGVTRVEAPDPHTVVFHLQEPHASFVSDAFSDVDLLPEHLLRGSTGKALRTAPF